jgi:ATP-binding cassette subfamily A (ABC1) protein 1
MDEKVTGVDYGAAVGEERFGGKPVGFFTQLRVLLWKNYTLMKRRSGRVALEVFFPFAFILTFGLLKLLATINIAPTGWSTSEGGTNGANQNLFQAPLIPDGDITMEVKPFLGMTLPRYSAVLTGEASLNQWCDVLIPQWRLAQLDQCRDFIILATEEEVGNDQIDLLEEFLGSIDQEFISEVQPFLIARARNGTEEPTGVNFENLPPVVPNAMGSTPETGGRTPLGSAQPFLLAFAPREANSELLDEINKMVDFMDANWSAQFSLECPPDEVCNWGDFVFTVDCDAPNLPDAQAQFCLLCEEQCSGPDPTGSDLICNFCESFEGGGDTDREAPVVPSFRDLAWVFESAGQMTSWIEDSEYKEPNFVNNPAIFAGIVVNDISEDGAWDYSIRMNTTQRSGDFGSELLRQTVIGREQTDAEVCLTKPSGLTAQTNVDDLQLELTLTPSYIYSQRGFMTFQQMMDRYILCKGNSEVCDNSAVENALRNNEVLRLETLDRLEERIGLSNITGRIPRDDVDILVRVLSPLLHAPQSVAIQVMPVANWKRFNYYNDIQETFALIFIVINLLPVSSVLRAIVTEKETKTREVLKMYGVRDSAIVLSWYMTYLTIFFFTALLSTIASCADEDLLFPNSNALLVFLFYYAFLASVMSFGYMVSTLFSRAKTASVCGMVLWFACYFVDSAVTDTTLEQNTLASILAPVALSKTLGVFASLEAVEQGVSFANSSQVYLEYTYETGLFMLIFDAILYTFIGIYLEQVLPKEFGVRLPWYFPVMPSFWFPSIFGEHSPSGSTGADDMGVSLLPGTAAIEEGQHIEAPGPELMKQLSDNKTLSLRNLRKTFSTPDGTKVAVNDLTLTMFEGQITCLLGHNGAGKTTTISMLTGLIEPTSGDAIIRGYSIKDTRDLGLIRLSLGVCPQHNVLFDTLTVEEHLVFYGGLKGFWQSKDALNGEVMHKVKEVGLTEKVLVPSMSLSGGMKRKLSVAIALMGDAKMVFLDEPTSGMDPYSRRSTWDILRNNREGRVMVLTTHFMDEADLLGDRIAIMAEGELRCVGSSLFLKNRYGAGYSLVMVKGDDCNEAEVGKLLRQIVPKAILLSDVGAEIAYQLPVNASPKFPQLFNEIDARSESLGISQYGISVTTMEEVFIKVGHSGDHDPVEASLTKQSISRLSLERTASQQMNGESVSAARVADASSTAPPQFNKTSNFDVVEWERPQDEELQKNLFFQHFHALFMKRFQYAKRDYKSVCCNTILPVLLLLVGLIILEFSGRGITQPEYQLSTAVFNDFNPSYANTPVPYDDDGDAFRAAMMGRSEASYPRLRPVGLASNEEFDLDFTQATVETFGVSYPTDAPYLFDNMYNQSRLNIGQRTYTDVKGAEQASLYGGFIFEETSAEGMVVPVPQLSYTIMANSSSLHAAPAFASFVNSLFYQEVQEGGGGISVSSWPVSETARQKRQNESFVAFAATIQIIIAFSFIPAAIITFVVREREASHNSKHQQLISGVSIPAYWISTFCWDLMVYMVPFALGILLIYAFQVSVFLGQDCDFNCLENPFVGVVVLFLLYGWAITSFTYMASYYFSTASNAQIAMILFSFVFGVLGMVVSFVLQIINETTCNINKQLMFALRLFPGFSLGKGLLNIAIGRNGLEAYPCYDNIGGRFEDASPFILDIIGWEVLYLAVTGVLYLLIAIGIDTALSYPSFKAYVMNDPKVDDSPYDVDEDVAMEVRRVESGAADDEVIVLKGLRKAYPPAAAPKLAVKELSFGIPKGECFGFLGINGAGKSSTLKILSGDIIPTKGIAFLGGFNILTQQIQCRRLIGYCPQFDALLDLLTSREHLEMFARIKGVPETLVPALVDEKLRQMDLTDFEHKLAGSLSGGNKRKLSVAIALIGSPPVIFLDEPSTGMDPVARRFMWDVIAKVSTERKDCSIVLTTHSMEECEALCTRTGIMVGGRLRCLGSNQHLKSRFGNGLQMEVKLTIPGEEVVGQLAQQCSKIFPKSMNSVVALLGETVTNANVNAVFAGELVCWIGEEGRGGWEGGGVA